MNKNNPSVESTNNVNTPQGRQLNQLDQDATPTGGAYGPPPRGLLVRPMYAAFRPGIYHDNHAEAFCDVGPGDAATRFILETWHSNRWTDGKGIQVLLPHLGQPGPTRPDSPHRHEQPAEFHQWPTVFACPAAMHSWSGKRPPQRTGRPHWRTASAETLSSRGQRRQACRAFRFFRQETTPAGDPDVRWTSPHRLAAGAQAAGAADAGAMRRPRRLHGRDASGIAGGHSAGRSAPPLTSTRSLCLIFQSPPQAAEAGVDAAVYAAISHNGGASFPRPSPQPANADAGEADLLVHGKRTDVALRVGPSGASSIACIRSDDGGETWSEPKSVTSDALYAEYPTLGAAADGMRLSFYGDLRANRALTPAGAMLAGTAGDVTAAQMRRTPRHSNDFAMDQTANGDWSPQRRILTEFPVLQAAWLKSTSS